MKTTGLAPTGKKQPETSMTGVSSTGPQETPTERKRPRDEGPSTEMVVYEKSAVETERETTASSPDRKKQRPDRNDSHHKNEPVKVNHHKGVESDNPKHRALLIDLNILGYRLDISRRFKGPTYIELNHVFIEQQVYTLMYADLIWRIRKEKRMKLSDVTVLATEYAELIAGAFMRAVYSKLRVIHYSLFAKKARYAERPSFSKDVELPTPLACAVQYLGTVRPSDLMTDEFLAPVHAEGITHEGSAYTAWTLPAYQRATLDLLSYGIKFSKIDVNLKEGSFWWLYRPRFEESRLELVLPRPPSNYTESSAIIRGMFLNAFDQTTMSDANIITMAQPATDNYGTMLREISVGMPNQFFHALNGDAEEEWQPYGM